MPTRTPTVLEVIRDHFIHEITNEAPQIARPKDRARFDERFNEAWRLLHQYLHARHSYATLAAVEHLSRVYVRSQISWALDLWIERAKIPVEKYRPVAEHLDRKQNGPSMRLADWLAEHHEKSLANRSLIEST